MPITKTILDLSTEMNAIVLDAFADSNSRSIAYAKSVWSIVGNPLASTEPVESITETLSRVEQINELTIAEVQRASQSALELTQKIAGHADKARSESIDGLRDFARGGFSSAKDMLTETEDRFEAVISAAPPSAN